MTLGITTMRNLMKKNGAQIVSEGACTELIKALEETAKKITEKAIITAAHACRKTIRADDIKLVRGIGEMGGG